MKNCPVHDPGSTPVSGVSFGFSPNQSRPKLVIARRNHSDPEQICSAGWLKFLWSVCCLFAVGLCLAKAQEPTPSASLGETQAEPVVVSATRTDIPLSESPASASVVTSQDIDAKQL